MEAILLDLRRAMRSFHLILHAVSGAGSRHGVEPGRVVPSEVTADVYGRRGRFDVYSGKEALEFYAMMARAAQPPFQP
ncbi:MAG: hypothetical protein NT061_09915 [Spirochaetes bacterium]|nr:hypothetical protein [Spirochaetota bacterium]